VERIRCLDGELTSICTKLTSGDIHYRLSIQSTARHQHQSPLTARR